jgi:hypothetical protein
VFEVVGVYLTKVSSSLDFIADAYKKEFSVFFAIFIPSSYFVLSRFYSLFSWLGLDKSAFCRATMLGIVFLNVPSTFTSA